MPTAPAPRSLNRRTAPTQKLNNNEDTKDPGLQKNNLKNNSDVDVAQIHLEWACPAPPCNKTFWWATKPKPVVKRGLDHKKHK